MATTPSERLAAHLNGQRPDSAFSTHFTTDTSGFALSVAGVGPITLGIGAAGARELKAVARPAHVGRGTETLHDKNIRDTWEITPEQVRLSRGWLDTVLPTILQRVHDDLGLPYRSTLSAQLQSLLVYGKDQFFAPHQDSEKNDAMVATLVVALPTVHNGGELIVTHAGEHKTYRIDRHQLSYTAFYTDCRHEVRPLRSGHRVSLVFNLLLDERDVIRADPDAELAALLTDYFTTDLPPHWSREEPEKPTRLYVLLDHEYSERGLAHDLFKGHDADRVASLRAAAAQAGCRTAVALTEIQETWEAPYDADDDFSDLLDNAARLTWWRPPGEDGSAITLTVADAEVCAPTPTVSLTPYQSEYEGYMGNYGTTVDRWYRRAALLIWPRTNDFAVHAELDPAAALNDVAQRITATDPTERTQAIVDAAALPKLFTRAPGQALPAALGIAAAVDDSGIAGRLLAKFQLNDLRPEEADRLAAVVAAYRLSWFAGVLFSLTDERALYGSLPYRRWIEAVLPAFSTRLRAVDAAPVADLVVDRVKNIVLAQIAEVNRGHVRSANRRATFTELGPALAALLCAAAPDASAPTLVALAAYPRDLDALLVAALRQLPSDSPVFGLLASTVRDRLEAILAEPPRQQGDWSIVFSGCGCRRCAALAEFSLAAHRIEGEWKMNEQDRTHLQNQIHHAELPMTWQTIKQGRPYTLVVTKTRALFDDEAQRRERAAAELAWLQEQE